MILTPFASRSRYVGILAAACLISIARADNQDYTPSGGGWEKTGNNSYEHKGATFSGFRYSDEDNATNTYKYEIGPPHDWSFVPSKTSYSGGTKIGDPTATYAGIQKINDAAGDPVSFVLSMGGELTRSGGGSGTVTWSASAKSRFFWLTASPSIVVKAGTAVTVTANGDPTESTWSVNSKEWKDHNAAGSTPYKVSSITLNRNMWDKMQWTSSPVPTDYLFPPTGQYNISATTTEVDARSASLAIYAVDLGNIRFSQAGASIYTEVDEDYKSIGTFNNSIITYRVSIKPDVIHNSEKNNISWSGILSGKGDEISGDMSPSGVKSISAEFYGANKSASIEIINRPTGTSGEAYALLWPELTAIAAYHGLTSYTGEAFTWANATYSGIQHNTIADAARHTYWSMLLTRYCGIDYAGGIGTGHEVGSVSPTETIMDLHNNAVGRSFALTHSHGSTNNCCRNVTQSLVSQGILKYLDRSYGAVDTYGQALLQPTNK